MVRAKKGVGRIKDEAREEGERKRGLIVVGRRRKKYQSRFNGLSWEDKRTEGRGKKCDGELIGGEMHGDDGA